ncbi:MAG: lytic transglycosylase domain-containing protein, partial [Elusimicrobia bacterium]|nr:lytic transglycosylase domain-containing protein [Elusimicrobiota bacterium]
AAPGASAPAGWTRPLQALRGLPAYAARRHAPAERPLAPPRRPDPEYRRLFRRMLARRAVIDRYDAQIRSAARERGLDPRLLKAVIGAESEFDPRARSPRGAMGLMQVMPATGRRMGMSRRVLRDPGQNIRAGASYIAHLYALVGRRYRLSGDMDTAPLWAVQRVLAAYHAGPRFLDRATRYRSTRLYVRRVMLFRQSAVTRLRG